MTHERQALSLSGGFRVSEEASVSAPRSSGSGARLTTAPIFYSLSSPTSSNGAGFPAAAATGKASSPGHTTRLSSAAMPFTPQRLGGPGYIDPSANSTWNSPDRMTNACTGLPPLTPSYHTTVVGSTPPATPLGQYTMEYIKANILSVATEQQGCRVLQRILDLPWEHSDVQEVVELLFPALADLMADAYGNFLVQKILDIAPDDVRLAITQLVSPSLASIATRQHGTFAAQKLVDSLRTAEERTAVCLGLAKSIVALCTDHHGAHVAQKVIALVGAAEEREALILQVAANILEIGRNRYGTCIVQRCIERCVNVPGHFDSLAQAIVVNVTALVLDPFGNYVVQRLIEQCPLRAKPVDDIVRCLTHESRDVFIQILTSQYSSKAVEKALQRANPALSSLFCAVVAKDDVMERSISDHFGNYIVQTGLALAASVVQVQHHRGAASNNAAASGASFTVLGSGDPTSQKTPGRAAEHAAVEVDRAVISRYMAFVSSVERHIGAVRLMTFGKKMEAKLEHAQRHLKAHGATSSDHCPAQTRPTGTPPGHAHHRRKTPPTPGQQRQLQQESTPPPEPSLRRRPPGISVVGGSIPATP